MSKHREVVDESVNVTSTNRSFQTVQHGLATFDQTKKILSHFYAKRNVEDDKIHTKA